MEDADLLASMGFNTIRLGVLWAWLGPVGGEKIVVMDGERGIYTLIDMQSFVEMEFLTGQLSLLLTIFPTLCR